MASLIYAEIVGVAQKALTKSIEYQTIYNIHTTYR